MIRRYKIGPAIIEIESAEAPLEENHPDLFYRFFDYAGPLEPSLRINIRTDVPPPFSGATPAAQVPDNWTLYPLEKGGWRLDILEPVRLALKQAVVLDAALGQADVFLADLPYHRPPGAPFGWMIVDLMEPFVQWWLTAWLALRWNGMVLHGSAVAWGETGMAFVGPSEAGKTTNARLFQDHGGATVLNDERILIWRDQGRWKISGSPWHGELRRMSPLIADLRRINLLQKGTTNELLSIAPTKFVAALSQEAFLPVWNTEAMTRLFDSIARLSQEPFAQRLVFKKDPSVVVFLKEQLGEPLAVH